MEEVEEEDSSSSESDSSSSESQLESPNALARVVSKTPVISSTKSFVNQASLSTTLYSKGYAERSRKMWHDNQSNLLPDGTVEVVERQVVRNSYRADGKIEKVIEEFYNKGDQVTQPQECQVFDDSSEDAPYVSQETCYVKEDIVLTSNESIQIQDANEMKKSESERVQLGSS